MLPLNTFVKFANYSWETGKHLIDVEVTLGSAEKSSSCKVVISDLDHLVAEAVINHSIKTGGIQQLEGTDKAKPVNIPGALSEAGKGQGISAGWASPEEHAFADACVKREPNGATTDIPMSYRSKNGAGFYPASILLPGAGFPAEAGTLQNIGRYQFNRGDWKEVVDAGLIKDFTPAEQDIIFRFKLYKRKRGGKQLTAGDLDAAFKQASNEWVSIPWNTKDGQLQPGTTKQEYIDYYNQQLSAYKGGKATVSTAPKVAEVKTPTEPSTTDTDKPVIKGSIIEVNINGYSFEFFHQGTEMSEDGKTILTGQGLRWLMSRRLRSRTLKDVTLKQLANQVATQHKVKLDYQSTIDPTYSHIDQSGISDYALLIRESELSGLMVTEDMKAKTLVVKERKQLGNPTYILERGVNLLTYKITDKALSSHEPEISATSPQSNKSVIDPVSGKQVNTKTEVDRLAGGVVTKEFIEENIRNLKKKGSLTAAEEAIYRAQIGKPVSASGTTTGNTKPAVGGTKTTGDNVISSTSNAGTKRIGGLPSTFVVPLSKETLEFTPLTTMLTKGFPGCLDRIWVVKTVTHSVSNNTSTLVLNSPVEVKGNTAPKIPGAKAEPNGTPGTGWVYPTSGTVTSLQSANRNGRPHNGVDIGAASGTPIYAAANGTVAVVAFQAGGAGNYIILKHAGGYFTRYFHMVAPSPLKPMDRVQQGDKIGEVGNTGASRGAHLHFEFAKASSGANLQVAETFPKLKASMNSVIANSPV